jgi:Xaa-Pro aminopeptidase
MRTLKKGELIVLDFGCRVGGYHSDLTRTVALGDPSSELRTMYATVREAQEQALRHCAAPIRARDLDGIARSHIRRAGFGKYFSHSLGHGIGLQVHEEPRVSAKSPATLVAGNVVTIEPGIYVPGFAGVRIEDDVLIGPNGPDILTRASKDLIIV